MFNSRVRGGSLVELALLTPFIAALSLAFLEMGVLFLRQLQLERLSAALVRELAALPRAASPSAHADAYLAERGLSAVEPTVEIRTLPSPARPFPRRNEPVLVLSLTLRRPVRGGLLLRAHAREIAS